MLIKAGNKTFYSKMGVVTPGCSGGGNPIRLVSICPANTGGFIKYGFCKH